jgi:2-polyprenyl-3-methyl-5-hydroxy-6-metoxy-1,4-benzoquinol methylase
MNAEQLRIKRREIVEQYGDWTKHNIHLTDDTYTYNQDHPRFKEHLVRRGVRLQRILQIISDITNQPLNNLRVLDLACLEGLYGIELARHGAEVIGIEGREANVVKARFAKDVLDLDNITFMQDDVRNLGVEKYGRFDVVLCIGILYHLDAPDVFHFVERMSEVCKRVTIIDTHVGINANKSYIYRDQEYHGWSYKEHSSKSTKEERLKSLRSSIDNEQSFWLTRPSLFNLLSRADFTSVYTCQNPAVPTQRLDRDTLVAIKGTRHKLFSTPIENSLLDKLWPEERRRGLHPSQQTTLGFKLREIPRRVRNLAKRIFG